MQGDGGARPPERRGELGRGATAGPGAGVPAGPSAERGAGAPRAADAPAGAPGGRSAAREPQELLQGTVDVVSYHDESSLYSVLRLAPEVGFEDPGSTELFRSARVTAVGALAQPSPGLRLRLSGRWVQHAAHGRQFQFETAEELSPVDRAGLVRYLSSQAFEGVGPKLAERIVDALGPRALEVIRETPQSLEAIPGLRPAVRETLVRVLRESRAQHELLVFLRGAGLGPQQALAALRALGQDAEALVRANPYVLARAPGLGFKTADRVALELGFAADGPERCRAALAHVLDAALGDGHSYLPQADWFEGAARLLELEAEDAAGERLEQAARELERRDQVAVETTAEGQRAVYLPWLAACERGLASDVELLLASGPARPLADARALAAIEAEGELVLHEKQRAAILGLLGTPLGLLTGGPGVGKTTIVRTVVELAQRAGARVVLVSPTGRAAKRLAEATGRDASTIHRALAYDPSTASFQHDRRRPLEADLVVADEISMLDVVLAYRLVQAVQPPARLVLVGDPDQLPSVGPGQVLHDLLASGRVPVWRLTEIYRQRPGSLIASNAHAILRGELPTLPEPKDLESDFYFFPAEDPAHCADLTVDIATRRIPKQFGIDFAEGVQVLAPMYKGECGVDALNERLRAALGIGGREVRRGERSWRTGDRVIHTRNDYEKGVFNGDVGRIVEVGQDGGVRVRFPEQDVDYAPAQLGDLQPAFALTVHRAQGGEYPAVVIPLTTRHALMLQRNLLYTAVTRARRLLVLVGSARALRLALSNTAPSRRFSRLAERLAGAASAPSPAGPPPP